MITYRVLNYLPSNKTLVHRGGTAQSLIGKGKTLASILLSALVLILELINPNPPYGSSSVGGYPVGPCLWSGIGNFQISDEFTSTATSPDVTMTFVPICGNSTMSDATSLKTPARTLYESPTMLRRTGSLCISNCTITSRSRGSSCVSKLFRMAKLFPPATSTSGPPSPFEIACPLKNIILDLASNGSCGSRYVWMSPFALNRSFAEIETMGLLRGSIPSIFSRSEFVLIDAAHALKIAKTTRLSKRIIFKTGNIFKYPLADLISSQVSLKSQIAYSNIPIAPNHTQAKSSSAIRLPKSSNTVQIIMGTSIVGILLAYIAGYRDGRRAGKCNKAPKI